MRRWLIVLLVLVAVVGGFLTYEAVFGGPRNGVTQEKVVAALRSTGYKIRFRSVPRTPHDVQVVAGRAYDPNGAKVDFAVSICQCRGVGRMFTSQVEPAVRYQRRSGWTAVGNVGVALAEQPPEDLATGLPSNRTELDMAGRMEQSIDFLLPKRLRGA